MVVKHGRTARRGTLRDDGLRSTPDDDLRSTPDDGLRSIAAADDGRGWRATWRARWWVSVRVAAFLGLLAASLADLGCRSAGEVVEETIQEPASGRSYRIIEQRDSTVGAGAAEPVRPVLLVLHPYAFPAEQLLRVYRLRERAVSERDWILVVPEGERDRKGHPFWNASAACCGADPGGPDDVEFLRAVLDDVARRRRIDSTRVFVFGVSNGGFLAYRFACEASHRVRAIVSIAGAGPGPRDPACAPERPISLLHVHGVRDETIRFAGGTARGAEYPGAHDSIAPWLRFAGGAVTRRSDRLHWFGPRVEIELHRFPTHRVELWTVPEADHGLSGLHHAVPRLLDFFETSTED